MLIHLHVYLWLYLATMVEVRGQGKEVGGLQNQKISTIRSFTKSLLTPGLNAYYVCAFVALSQSLAFRLKTKLRNQFSGTPNWKHAELE